MIQGISDTSPIVGAEGFHSLISRSGVVRQSLASPADSFSALDLLVPVILQRVREPKWPAAGLRARRPNRVSSVSHAEVLRELRACR